MPIIQELKHGNKNVTIPKAICDALNWVKGDELVFLMEKGTGRVWIEKRGK